MEALGCTRVKQNNNKNNININIMNNNMNNSRKIRIKFAIFECFQISSRPFLLLYHNFSEFSV